MGMLLLYIEVSAFGSVSELRKVISERVNLPFSLSVDVVNIKEEKDCKVSELKGKQVKVELVPVKDSSENSEDVIQFPREKDVLSGYGYSKDSFNSYTSFDGNRSFIKYVKEIASLDTERDKPKKIVKFIHDLGSRFLKQESHDLIGLWTKLLHEEAIHEVTQALDAIKNLGKILEKENLLRVRAASGVESASKKAANESDTGECDKGGGVEVDSEDEEKELDIFEWQ